MDWSTEHFSESAASEMAPPAALGALRAVLAAAERLGVARGQLLAAVDADAAKLDALDRAALAQLAPPASRPPDAFRARVVECMTKLLAEGRLSVEDVARELAVSPRTLQRRLEHAGTTFG